MKKKRKTIAVVTGIRSEYHILKPVMQAIKEHDDLSLKVIVSGAHLSKHFGMTWKEVAQDFSIDFKIRSYIASDTLLSRGQGIAKLIKEMSLILETLQPDFTCVLGDREESLAVATSCCYAHLACAHISGGDRGYGTVDDSVRHAVSKLAHLHFPTTLENKKRLLFLGEEPWRIHHVGASGLDHLKQTKDLSRKEFFKQLQLPDQDFVVVLQHPTLSDYQQSASHMCQTLQVIKQSGLGALIIYPNSDPGSSQIIRAINDFKKPADWRVFKTLNGSLWKSALKHSIALVGNSSAGLIEAPFLECPAINIGVRQTDRACGKNVIRVAQNNAEIEQALKKVQNKNFLKKLKEKKEKFLYGDGKTGPRIAKILAQTPINNKLLLKRITY